MAKKKKKAKAKKVKVTRKKKSDDKVDESGEEEDPQLARLDDFNPLPQKIRTPILDLTLATTLMHGPVGVGKTTLANCWPGVWFLATEVGQTWITTHEPTMIDDWPHFLDVCGWIATNKPKKFGDGKPLRTLVVDTVDLLFKFCYDSVCDDLQISSPSDLDYGVGWHAIGDEFGRVITKLTKLPYGLIFISHSKEKQIKSKARKIDRIQPALMETGLKIVAAISDLILYCNVNETAVLDDEGVPTGAITETRVIRCQPESNLVAKDRTGQLPDEIEMNYQTLVSYFPKTKRL